MRDKHRSVASATALKANLAARELVERIYDGDRGCELIAFLDGRRSRL